VIQYWFSYPINDYIGNHEGTEHINVVVNESRNAVAEVQYFFHARSIRLPGDYRPDRRQHLSRRSRRRTRVPCTDYRSACSRTNARRLARQLPLSR
jgi:hypothetical protein